MELMQIFSSSIIGIIIGAMSVYFTAYLKEKGKSRALQENINDLEDEKQSIISKYQKDIEDVKKAHQLDIEKRKHQYESKKSQYYQFMQEIDEFNGCLARTLSDDLSQIMLKFYEYASGVSSASKNALTVEFNQRARTAVENVKTQEMKLFSRLNAFKLSTNNEIITLLEEMMGDIQKSEKILVDILEYIGSPKFQISRNVPESILIISDSNRSNLANTKAKLMAALKYDLDEI
ncbi:hypothetical protein [Aliivibrio logei]|nr:hypothetical protein [Aliivibrio logei]